MAEKDAVALIKCKNGCGNHKFATDTVWEKITDKQTLDFFEQKVSEGKYILNEIVCPDCTPLKIEIQSELQPGDIVPKSSLTGFEE